VSTKKIADVLRCLRNGIRPSDEDVGSAGDELETIREAAKTLERLHVGDYTYKVRESERVLKETPNDESTWDHPDVVAWSNASVLLAAIAKET
jgi:hypothetical protein